MKSVTAEFVGENQLLVKNPPGDVQYIHHHLSVATLHSKVLLTSVLCVSVCNVLCV